ncbi:Protein of unknown function DUF227,Protein kinase-like domain,CHK kinase-like [Cinara cedri]|uniref:CHK kinase-like domain-containing protein n=1 Tax=Cinara cedri TaxID=506608 RepID=A0A5E4NNQ0_9HEMI|nr:Protein of unknown function DUF227,Protein kinase-like domain,CHK kinase-like [Cinara cedri]
MAVTTDWSMDRAVAEMIDAGAFGSGSEFVALEPDSQRTGQDQYASTVYFGTAIVRDRDRDRHSHQLVFKLKHRDPGLRDLYCADWQFHNEILFYERISPFFEGYAPTADHVPPLARYYYGRNDCGDRVLGDMVVLENAGTRGYRLSEQRLYLDRDHIVVALRTLAKFHGLSYRANHENPVKFAEMIADVKETQLRGDDDDWMLPGFSYIASRLLSVALDRVTERRVAGGDDDDDVNRIRRFRTKFLDEITRTLRRLLRPVEQSLATLCHGDFNRNNLLFRYDDDGRPVDALPFDLATVRYGSPALDLSFFLYMNTDRRIRDERWDELLDTYCASLAAAVSDVADVVRVPDRPQLDAEMREYGVYGLVHVSYFVRVMMAENLVVDPSSFVESDIDTSFEILMSYGGDKATDLVADAVQHYLDTYGSCTE